jgi:glucosamine kinase
VVGTARVGTSAYKSVGLEAAAAALVAAVVAALPVDAGARGVLAVLAAVSDVDTAADREALRGAFERALGDAGVRAGRLDVSNDSVAALASGTGGLARGIACIAGTGSVCLGLDGLGGEARTGGWGPPFGDGGSGYWIAFRAISRALELHDAGRRDSRLIEELLTQSGCATLPELLFGHVGAGSDSENAAVYRGRVAALARAVDRAATDGDPDAREVFAAAGRELAKLVTMAAGRLRLGAEPFDLVRVGGVWGSRIAELHDAFAEGLADLPGARLTAPSIEPAVGAALLARELSRTGQACPGGLIE